MNLITQTIRRLGLGTPCPLGAFTFYPLLLTGNGRAPCQLPQQSGDTELFTIDWPDEGPVSVWQISNAHDQPVLLLESVPHDAASALSAGASDEESVGMPAGRCTPGISTLIPARTEELKLSANWFGPVPALAQSESSFWDEAPPLEPGQSGWLCLHDTGVIGFDLFDCQETLKAAMPGLYEHYANDNNLPYLDAKVVPVAGPKEVLDLAARAEYVWHSSLGDGQYYRVVAPGLLGYALVLESHLVHLSVVPSPIFDVLRSDRALRQQQALRLASLGRHAIR